MIKIKDRILLGTVSGVLSAYVARLINRFNYNLGLTDIRYNPLAARLFLPKKACKTKEGALFGSIVNNINVACHSIGLTYLLSATGKDHYIFKGLGTGAFSWIMVDGIMASQLLNIKSSKPLGPAVRLFEHLIFGGLSAVLITRLGDESLFPPKVKQPLKRIPLLHTGINQVEE